MARVAGYAATGVVAFGAILYGRLYVDVLTAESAVRAVEREVRATETERENLKHEISSSRKSLAELEAKGTQQLQERAALQQRVDETSSLLTKLKDQLFQSKNDSERLQLKMKDTTQRIDRLQRTDTEKAQFIELAKGRRSEAQESVLEAKKAMELNNLPIMGSLFVKPPSK